MRRIAFPGGHEVPHISSERSAGGPVITNVTSSELERDSTNELLK